MSRKAPTPCPNTLVARPSPPPSPPPLKKCTCEEQCNGRFRDCPSAISVEGGDFKWKGEYYQEAVVDDVIVSLGLTDGIDIQQPADEEGEFDLILVFGIESIRKLRAILQQAEKIIEDREKVR